MKARNSLVEIPKSKDSKLVSIMGKQTTAIAVFIPKQQVEEGNSILPAFFTEEGYIDYLEQLKNKAEYFRNQKTPFVLASDRNCMTEPQWQNLLQISNQLGIKLLDISTLEHYNDLPYLALEERGYPGDRTSGNDGEKQWRPAKDRYRDISKQPFAEYIDKVKLMLGNLAGKKVDKEEYGNILVTDFDVDFGGEPLQIPEGEKYALAYTKRQTTFAEDGPMGENSLIFVSKDRPTFKDDSGKEKDLMLDLLSFCEDRFMEKKDLHKANRALTTGDVYSATAIGAFVKLVYKLLVSKGKGHLATLTNLGDNDGKEKQKFANDFLESGRGLLHGSYFSENLRTWQTREVHYRTIEEASNINEDTFKPVKQRFSEWQEAALEDKKQREAEELNRKNLQKEKDERKDKLKSLLKKNGYNENLPYITALTRAIGDSKNDLIDALLSEELIDAAFDKVVESYSLRRLFDFLETQNKIDFYEKFLSRGLAKSIPAEIIGDAVVSAARAGNLDVLKVLLETSQANNIPAKKIGDALYWGAREGNLDIVKAVLDTEQIKERKVSAEKIAEASDAASGDDKEAIKESIANALASAGAEASVSSTSSISAPREVFGKLKDNSSSKE